VSQGTLDVRSLEIETLVRRGFESPDVDYKASGNWRDWSSDQKAELIRDMMAMGNSDRPGWIIFGVAEAGNGSWSLDGVDPDDATTFDATAIGSKLKRHCDPEVSFASLTAVVDSKSYVAIRVSPFETVPHICKASSGSVLDEGAVYVRTEACQTTKVTTAEQMRRLIDRGTQNHADAIVGRIERLIGRSRGTPPAAPEASGAARFEAQIEELRARLASAGASEERR
jgi:predicted HTH transcriptional regulator